MSVMADDVVCLVMDKLPHTGMNYVLLSHSMGSVVVRLALARLMQLSVIRVVTYLSYWLSSAAILREILARLQDIRNPSGVLLSGPPAAPGRLLNAVYQCLLWLVRPTNFGPSLASKIIFGGYDSQIRALVKDPNLPQHSWLSTDEDTVRRYTEDPLCGHDVSIDFWSSLLSNLSKLTDCRAVFGPKPASRDLVKVLVMGGADDMCTERGKGVDQTEFEEAQKIAANRPRAGTWESPHARPLTAYPSTHELNDFTLDGASTDPDRGVGLDNPFLAGQFFQTNKLPGSMTSEERAKLAQSLAPTATYEMLSKIPSDLVEMETPEGQDLRQRLLRGATVVFFCAGYPGKKFIYQRAAELGVKSVIIDSADSWSKQLVDEGVIAKFIGLDMNQAPEEIFERSVAAIKALKDDPLVGECEGICTFADLAVPMASRLGEALGLPCLPPSAVDKTRNKYATRDAMKAYGMPVVRNYLIKNELQLEKAAEFVGFPAVLKPISGAASLGVKKVESAADLDATYHELSALLLGLRVSSGALEQVAENDNASDDEASEGVNANEVISLDMVLEEYLDGDEVDVDVIMDDGKCRFCSVSDNGPTVEPYFNESWAVLPSLLPERKAEELQDMAIDALVSVGFSKGLFHVEGKYTRRGPRLIEINSRMGGGPVRMIHQQVEGVDLVVEQLFLACGIPSRPQPHEGNCAVAYGFALNERSGVIKDLDFIERHEESSHVLQLEPLVKPGEHVVGPEEGMPTWLAVIVIKDETSEMARDECQRLMKVIADECAASLV